MRGRGEGELWRTLERTEPYRKQVLCFCLRCCRPRATPISLSALMRLVYRKWPIHGSDFIRTTGSFTPESRDQHVRTISRPSRIAEGDSTSAGLVKLVSFCR